MELTPRTPAREPRRRSFPAAIFSARPAPDGTSAQQHRPRLRALSVQCFRRSDFPELMQRVPSFFLFLSEKLANRLFRPRTDPFAEQFSSNSPAALGQLRYRHHLLRRSSSRCDRPAHDRGRRDGEAILPSTLKGAPRWGRFEHLNGEKRSGSFFLHEHRSGTFSFSNETQVRADWSESRRSHSSSRTKS